MDQQVFVRSSIESDLPQIARIYRESFPTQWRVRSGQHACEQYLRCIYEHKAYEILVVETASQLVGFAILHLDMKQYLGRKWIWSVWPSVLKLVIRYPHAFLKHVLLTVASKIKNCILHSSQPHCSIPPPQDIYRKQRAYLEFMGVDLNSRSKGYGKIILQASIEEVKKHGINSFCLTVRHDNISAINLYKKVGFRKVSNNVKSNSSIYCIHF